MIPEKRDIKEVTATIPLDFYMESIAGPWIQERKLNTVQKISQGNIEMTALANKCVETTIILCKLWEQRKRNEKYKKEIIKTYKNKIQIRNENFPW